MLLRPKCPPSEGPKSSTSSTNGASKKKNSAAAAVAATKKSGTTVHENAKEAVSSASVTNTNKRIAKTPAVPPTANPKAMTQVSPHPAPIKTPVRIATDQNAIEVNKALLQMVGKVLTAYTWYHGLMPRTECEGLLTKDGDFVVRRTTVKKISIYCISANTIGAVKHIPLDYKKGLWSVSEDSADTLNGLIDHLVKEKKVIGATGVTLRNGIPRPDFYILHENVTIDKRIGGGAFGEVFTGSLRIKDNELEMKVAVKKIKGQVSKDQATEFIKEAKLMRRFSHPNIVGMYGIAPQEEPIMIILELAAGGSLKDFFKKNPTCKDEQCTSFVKDACRGMCYLSSSEVIHRDLAARNCLLGAKNEVKISDFGLSVADKKQLVITKMKNVPVKWLSPETLTQGVFTTKTDVWSFGVLTWEIFSRCKTDPFPNETNAQAKMKILGEGAPMEPPTGSPPITKQVMDQCFVKDVKKRADFVGLLKLVAPVETPPSKVEQPKSNASAP